MKPGLQLWLSKCDISIWSTIYITKIQETCSKCHAVHDIRPPVHPKSYVYIQLNETEEMLKEVKPGTDETSRARRFYEEAKYNYHIVDKGKGSNNPTLAKELLQDAGKKLDEALQLFGIEKENIIDYLEYFIYS